MCKASPPSPVGIVRSRERAQIARHCPHARKIALHCFGLCVRGDVQVEQRADFHFDLMWQQPVGASEIQDASAAFPFGRGALFLTRVGVCRHRLLFASENLSTRQKNEQQPSNRNQNCVKQSTRAISRAFWQRDTLHGACECARQYTVNSSSLSCSRAGHASSCCISAQQTARKITPDTQYSTTIHVTKRRSTNQKRTKNRVRFLHKY